MNNEDDVQKPINAMDGARVFTGNHNDDLVSTYVDLVQVEFRRLLTKHPKFDRDVLMAMAQKTAGRIDPVGKSALQRLADLTRSLLTRD